MSLVDQEPVLLNTTIFENIRHGLVSVEPSVAGEDLDARVMQAAKEAHAHDFVVSLPLKYQTFVGDRGVQLSRGQRQRIAIARAIIKNPSVLLLDEATSALDANSESLVQRALDSSAAGRTTIIIAHRLATIRNADNIVVMSEGRVVEQGKHEDLIARKGLYAGMVDKQSVAETFTLSRDRSKEHDTIHQSEKQSSVTSELIQQPQAAKLMTEGSKSIIDTYPADGLKVRKLGLLETLRFIARLNRPERSLLICGLICATIAGVSIPMYGHSSREELQC